MSSADHTLPRFDLPAFAEEPVSPALVGGRYRLLSKTGAGSSAVVYRALDLVTEQDVAVKLFHAGIAGRDFLRREREFRVLADLRHPGLVEFRDSGFDLDRAYLVMRLVEGPTVAGRILCGPLSVRETTQLGIGVAEALAYVHSRGITHRDLKPANVLLAEDRPLLTDFGLAHRLGSSDLTASGAVVGTAAYMAPEQVRGKEVGPPADIYALGLILLECLTGYREYPGAMVESALARLTRTPEIPDFVPPALAVLLTHMTAESAANRPTAAQIAAELTTMAAADETTVLLRPVATGAAVADLAAADTPAEVPERSEGPASHFPNASEWSEGPASHSPSPAAPERSKDPAAHFPAASDPSQVDAPTRILQPVTTPAATNAGGAKGAAVETATKQLPVAKGAAAEAATKQLPVLEPRRRRRRLLLSAVLPTAGVALAGLFTLNSDPQGLPTTQAPNTTPPPPAATAPATPIATATLVPIGGHPTGGSQQHQGQVVNKESKAKPANQGKEKNPPQAPDAPGKSNGKPRN
ncbi:serine/threonine-protein kinase [Amycolatopsis sp. 195334CR]|uniref:serine/threonine-protein kinase n=1 Tax=Amycolatopsis sp. 195334CR TaxID=2814588 RepID=UPI001A8F8CA3|nr:serine/threonine-protein kinase [Amycolatopsis sp. 195334CR]MBN6041832.1 protein kinase [Amycolatopsis sp. 195334CR]